MRWHLATDANIRILPTHEQLFAFAYAYLAAAKTLCSHSVARAEERDWPSGAVVLMNAAHAVELFLKAMLLRSNREKDVWTFGHNISALAAEYEKQFPDQFYFWDIPFRKPEPQNLEDEQLRIFREGTAQASIEFRYPVNRLGYPWITLQSFEPHSFQRDLSQIEEDFDRLYQGVA